MANYSKECKLQLDRGQHALAGNRAHSRTGRDVRGGRLGRFGPVC